MLFYSPEFLLAFLPLAILAYLIFKPWVQLRMLALIGASFVFYAYWEWRYVPILVCSILFNYGVHYFLTRTPHASAAEHRYMLVGGIAGNLLLLGWFKYAHWFAVLVRLADPVADSNFSLASAALPLGISFFTFQQISMLVDTWRNPVRYSLVDSASYVAFFPQLIAGPIVRHNELIPQFHETPDRPRHLTMVVLGVAFFTVGYLKKVYLADNLAVYANFAFADAAADGANFRTGWLGALSYTFQLYFDFSGYADMAIGLGLFFGVKLPINFNSPYKATSIADFWRRWHITLSHFLRDYLYIPLGGSRSGLVVMLFALMTTMVLGGLWHGAGWTFIVWGALHGTFLCLNHFWRFLGIRLPAIAGWLLTFPLVVVGWVFFRAPSLDVALEMIRAMFDFRWGRVDNMVEALVYFQRQAEELGLGLLDPRGGEVDVARAIAFIVLGAVVAFGLPNLNRLLNRDMPFAAFTTMRGQIVGALALAFGLSFAGAILVVLSSVFAQALAPPQFIYFNF